MNVTKWSAALAAGLWVVVVCAAWGQPANPFADSGPAATATPAPATGGGSNTANPFSSGGQAAPTPAPVSSAPGVASPFESGGVPGVPSAPAAVAAPSSGAPEPTPAASPEVSAAPVSGSSPSSAQAKEESDLRRRAQELGMTASQLRLEIEKSKERVTELYAQGEYTQALREIDLLEKLSPGNAKAQLIRQRIRERVLAGKPEGRPIREEFERSATGGPSPEVSGAVSPVPGEGGPGPSGVVPPAPPPAPLAPAAAPGTGFGFIAPVAIAAAVAVLALVAVMFFMMRRSRQRVHEAMTLARSSGAERPLGTPSFPSPQLATGAAVAGSPFASPASPAPHASADVFADSQAPSAEEAPAEAQEQQEEVYDLPTMILTEESPEGLPPEVLGQGAPPEGGYQAGARRETPPPAAAASAVAELFGAEPPVKTEVPEIHETAGATFKPYGPSERAIGEVVSGVPSADSASAPPAVPSRPAAAVPAPPPAAFPPPPPQPAAPANQEAPPVALPAFAPRETKLDLPDIFAADGSVALPGGEQSVETPPVSGPPSLEEALRQPPAPSEVVPDFLKSAASAPSGYPEALSPLGASEPAMPSASATPSSGGASGDLSLDDLLFATSRGASETQTVGQATAPGAGAAGGITPGRAPETGSPTPSADDLTQMSFGKEFDRLMFKEPDADRTVSESGVGGVAVPGKGPQEDETLMETLFPGSAASPAPSPVDKTAIVSPAGRASLPSETGAPPSALAGETQKFPAQTLDQTVKLPTSPAAQPRNVRTEEALYHADREKGLDAFNAGDWKQAIHYLSVAASLHPEDQEVCEKLQEARKQRRAASGM